jgi:hypothetical protein
MLLVAASLHDEAARVKQTPRVRAYRSSELYANVDS